MQKMVTASAAVIGLTLVQTGLAEDAPLYDTYGNWSIRVDTSLDYGCFLFSEFEGGSVFRLGVDRTDGSVYVLVGNPDWKSIEFGKTYPVSMKFGDESPWSADATGFSFDLPKDQPFLSVQVAMNPETMGLFMAEFMEESSFQLFYRGSSVANLSLKGSYAAAMKLFECQVEVNSALDQRDPFSDESDPFGEPSSKMVTDPFAS